MNILVISIYITILLICSINTASRIFIPILSCFILLLYIRRYPTTIIILLSVFVVYYRNFIIVKDLIYLILLHGGVRNTTLFQKSALNFLQNNFNLKHNLNDLPKNPTIYVGNYPCSYIESISLCLIPNTTIMMAEHINTKYTWGKLLDDIIYRKKFTSNYDDIKKQISDRIKIGKSVFVYLSMRGVEGHRQIFSGRVRTGILRIAKELGVTVTPIAFDYIKTDNGRIINQEFNIMIGQQKTVDDPVKFSREIRIFYRNNLRKFIKNKLK